MTTPKLSKAQRELLEAMQRGVEVLYESIGCYFFRTDTHTRCGKTAQSLVNNKLASYRFRGISVSRIVLTQSGKDWRP
jgi:hypothetical protein